MKLSRCDYASNAWKLAAVIRGFEKALPRPRQAASLPHRKHEQDVVLERAPEFAARGRRRTMAQRGETSKSSRRSLKTAICGNEGSQGLVS
ncbi:hypothetical protein AK812_SmicGene1790 [Symbiodinium microadriaticum]|uniref:Uncharacterized protein n=1 Tax=Symbiodinium microadriaticum TaxID=2951 RepID=A0A1Q9F3B0_SYMMI|nr:hypothetical protein AK812_SmicGene1790 [Symbiodinium microadriaticum]CAE7857875.1 unnamed protein product [Symbiodinium microadriaticum]